LFDREAVVEYIQSHRVVVTVSILSHTYSRIHIKV